MPTTTKTVSCFTIEYNTKQDRYRCDCPRLRACSRVKGCVEWEEGGKFYTSFPARPSDVEGSDNIITKEYYDNNKTEVNNRFYI